MKRIIFRIFAKSKIIKRRYYATGLGTLSANLMFKHIFRLYHGDFLLHFTSRINSSNKIKIANWDTNSSVHLSLASSSGCYYQAINGIHFGNETIWAPNVMFISANHDLKDIKKSIIADPIEIGNHVWIGANSVILPNVKIGDYCVVGAGAVVTKSFSDYCIIAGNPARVIDKRCQNCLGKISIERNICSQCESEVV